MSDKIIVPTLGESVTEATVSKWLKSQGEKVAADEPIVELETDKVNVEVPSPSNGVLEKISVKEGQTVNVGALLGMINGSAKQTTKEIKEVKNYSPPKSEPEENSKFTKETKILKKEYQPLKLKEEEALILDNVVETEKEQIIQEPKKREISFSPAARKMAKESKVNLSNLKGTGKHGVVLKEDIMSLMGSKPSPSERKIKYGPEERIKMTRLRLTIAKRLKEAQENAAMLTTFNEVDMSEVISLRDQYKEEFKKNYGVKLGFMSFFVKACVIGLKNFPAVNAEIQGDEIVYKNYYNISIAVGTDRGLVVPVLRESDEMSFADIEKKISELGEKARDGKITIDDLQGGTFTITNGGIYGSMLSTPILNLPQSAVLGMHNIVQRPVAIDATHIPCATRVLKTVFFHRVKNKVL